MRKNKTTDASRGGISIGCAGWSLTREAQAIFPAGDSHLARYATRLPAVEINSSFYRPHRPATYRRWAESVPSDFRFSVKIPKSITHERRLEVESDDLQIFLDEVAGLNERLGCLLVQLPPSLQFDAGVATRFFKLLQQQSTAAIVCEPRHITWFSDEAESLLMAHGVSRVAADPAVVPSAANPGGAASLVYYRWHGSPHMYYSDYSDAQLSRLADSLHAAQARGTECWCIFDNTAAGAAIQNALTLWQSLAASSQATAGHAT